MRTSGISGAYGARSGAADARTSRLFGLAFTRSRNPMVLLNDRRRVVDANGAFLRLLGYRLEQIVGRPLYALVALGALSEQQWQAALLAPEVTGDADLITAAGGRVGVQWAAAAETVTGRRLVLVVVLSTSRWGPRFRRPPSGDAPAASLTPRERDVVSLIALGYTSPEISDELRIAGDTVNTHVRHAMEKVGARSRAHLVALALADGHALP